jgi:hypothetical protein
MTTITSPPTVMANPSRTTPVHPPVHPRLTGTAIPIAMHGYSFVNRVFSSLMIGVRIWSHDTCTRNF